MLKLRCKREKSGDFAYTSGEITTAGKVTFYKGRIEIRAKLNYARGTWPSFWTMNAGWWSGYNEIDVFEQLSGSDWIGGCLHVGFNGATTSSNHTAPEDGVRFRASAPTSPLVPAYSFEMAFDMNTAEKTFCTESAPVPGHAPSLLPPGRWNLVWHDEFDGDRLDDTKWGYRTCFWGRRAHWFATPEDGAVEVRDSLCRLKLTKRPGEAVSHVPEFILISAEAKDFRQNMMTGPAAPGLEAALAAGDDFLIDYVRVFDPAD